jgi:hypothetical protein
MVDEVCMVLFSGDWWFGQLLVPAVPGGEISSRAVKNYRSCLESRPEVGSWELRLKWCNGQLSRNVHV